MYLYYHPVPVSGIVVVSLSEDQVEVPVEWLIPPCLSLGVPIDTDTIIGPVLKHKKVKKPWNIFFRDNF